ncbi:MAG: membrane protein insertase YidC, partial [Proteobacteria bacterium]|nr:membrane protein insertase YidC [Pseudomonadota bacterium]
DDLVELVHVHADGILPGGAYIGSQDDSMVKYDLDPAVSSGPNCQASGQSLCTLSLVGKLGSDTIRKTFSFKGDSYLLGASVVASGALAQHPAWLEWSQWVSADESHQRLNPLSFKILSSENKVHTVMLTQDHGGVSNTDATQWVSIEGRYFLASLLPFAQGPNGYTIHETHADGSHTLYGRIAGAPGTGSYNLYLGPKDSQTLTATGYQLNRNIDLGYFSFLAFPMLWLLRFFHSIVGNYGISIILLTLLIKTAFLPLTMVSFRSARAMQDLQPEIKALRERITDPTQLNQEMMSLYKKRGVNPLGGCFPVLIQIPVFIGLYNALLNAIELRHAPFALWIHDLSAPERLMIGGAAVQLMVLILGVSMFMQQYMTPTPGMEPAQRKVLLAMPVVLTASFLIYPLPAGLVLYWIVNNTISITQQLYIKGARAISPMQATLIAGAALVAVGYLLTIL